MGTYILNKYTIVKFKLDPNAYNVLIRITSPFEELKDLENKSQYREILELKFYDFEKETNGLKIFDIYELDTIVKFFQRHEHCDNMVIHCEQGISRSAGVAVGWLLYKDDRGSIYKIYHSNRHMPNKRIVDMFALKLNVSKKYMDSINKWSQEIFQNYN